MTGERPVLGKERWIYLPVLGVLGPNCWNGLLGRKNSEVIMTSLHRCKNYIQGWNQFKTWPSGRDVWGWGNCSGNQDLRRRGAVLHAETSKKCGLCRVWLCPHNATDGVAEFMLTWGGQWVDTTGEAPKVHLASKMTWLRKRRKRNIILTYLARPKLV